MNRALSSSTFSDLLQRLQTQPTPEHVEQWPGEHFELLQQAGGWRWNIGRDFGGDELSSAEMLTVYRELASVSLVTTFILTQRNAACQRIELAQDSPLKTRLLRQLCDGKIFATVGISHLTTSRQHMATPAVAVRRSDCDRGFQLTGSIPWATSATQAQVIVTGGTMSNQTQILAAVPTDRDGVTIQTPVSMLALNASQTGAVQLNDVFVADEEVLHGPVEKVMSQGQGGGAGSLGTSALAIGAAQGTLRQFADEARRRTELQEFLEPLQSEAADLAQTLERAAIQTSADAACSAESIRRRANSLVTRAAQVWLAATKGAGFVSGHPAELAVRESMFFLVWSCPQPVLTANLRELSCTG